MRSGLRTALTLELTAIAAALLLLGQPAQAQTPEPAKPGNGLERAQKAADAVFHWIKLNGDKGANRQPANAPPPPPPPPPAPAPVARKPAAAPVAAAPKPAAPAVSAPAPVQTAAAPAAAPAQPEPEPPPVLMAAASPTPAPAAPLPVAAAAVEPPPAPPPAEEEETPLKLVSKVNPSIPRAMQQTAFRDGYARVKFTVAPNGTVSKAETIAASHSRLGISAVDAVRQWRFEPIKAPREVAIEFAFNNTDE